MNENIEKETETNEVANNETKIVNVLMKNIDKIHNSEAEITKLLQSWRLNDEVIELIETLHWFVETVNSSSEFRKEQEYLSMMSEELWIDKKEFKNAHYAIRKNVYNK